MIATVILAFSPVPQNFEIQPQPIEWEQLGPRTFDRRWCLPENRRAPGKDLLTEMEALLEVRFELPGEEPGGRPLRSLGDLVSAARKVDGAERRDWLELRLRADRKLATRWGDALRQLLLDDQLRAGRWDPDDDGDRDGFLVGEAWDLEDEGVSPWKDLSGETVAEQAATLVFADLADWKRVENDYRSYPTMIGADYEAIRPSPGTYRRGVDPEGRAFASLAIYFRCDLPFPFSDYDCDLRILNRTDDAGRLVTFIYSTSEDFHWMVGKDVFLPVTSSEGERVAYLVVRIFGFDLDGVPDRRKHRRAGLRQGLGNLKLRAEALHRRRGVAVLPETTIVPEFRVLGRR